MKIKDLKKLIIDSDLSDEAEIVLPKINRLVKTRANPIRLKKNLTILTEGNKEPNALLISQDD